jgi:hypothetical protein
MFSLSIIVGPTCWLMMFKKREKLDSAIEHIKNAKSAGTGTIRLTDDYGHTAEIDVVQVYGFLTEDMNESKFAHRDRAIHEAHVRIDIQHAMQTDPKLRTAQMAQGPPILSPFSPRQ